MATKASGTLVLIIEKKHAPWGHMVSASPSLELRLWCRLRIASEWPLVDPSCQSSGPYEFRAGQWLKNGLSSLHWATEACLAAAGHISHGFGCRLASYGAPTALGVCIEHFHGRVSGGLKCQNGTPSLCQ